MGADFFSKNYDFGKAEIIVLKTALIYYTPPQPIGFRLRQ